MFFPVGDTQVQGGYKPIVAYSFLVINILIFLFQFSLGTGANQFLMTYGSIPAEITSGQDYYTLITSMFLHGGWMHLIGNMLFLWVFGDNIEATIGSVKFFIFYIFGGLAASGAHIFFNWDSNIPCVGASGAIAAVLGAYLVMFPKSKIKILVVILFRNFEVPAIAFLGLWFGQQLLSGVGEIGNTADTSGVAWWAHIGGFVFGVAFGFLFKGMIRKDVKNKIPSPKDYV